MALRAIHHVQLAMPRGGEDAARAFYSGVLGIPEVPKPEPQAARGGCWFERGELRIHLGVEDDFRPARKAHPAFIVDDLRAMLPALGDAATVTDWPNGASSLYLDDPFGNRIELIEPLDPHKKTLEALADVDSGRVIDHDVIQAWSAGLATDEPPPPV